MESVGGSYDAATAGLSPFKLKTGKAPHGPGEVAIDAGTAEKKHYEVGDSVVVSTLGKKHTYRISGTLSYGDVDSLGFASIAAWDVKTAQALLDREGRYDVISVAAKDGTSSAQLVNAIKPLVGSDLEVKDSKVAAKDSAENINDGMKTIRLVLLGFGGIALLVGAFVIFNTLSITVAQRTREFATLRTLGASRKQVKRSVVLEGLVIGLARLGGRAGRGHRHRQGHDRPDERPGRRPARGQHGDRHADGHGVDARRHLGHGARQRPARAQGDPRAAHRGGPRGLDAPARPLRGALGEERARRAPRLPRGARDRHVRRRGRCPHGPPARPRRARAVHGHRAAGAEPGQAPRPRGGLAGASRRRRRR